MKIYNFDLLAYPQVPTDVPRTPVPSSFFDPAEGCRNYEEHFYEMEHCEQLGFEETAWQTWCVKRRSIRFA